VWRYPRALPAGTTYDGPARHIDVVPTVLALLGLRGGESTQGADLLPALQGRAAPPDLTQYSEARLAEEGFGMAPLSGVRHDGWKYIRAPRPELYDLRHDPRERTDRSRDDPGVAVPLREGLDRVTAESARRALRAPTRTIDRETEEMLRALGYLAPPEQRAEMAGMDPKDGIALYATLQEARQLAQMEQWDRARALLEQVLAASPANVTARNVLALAAVRRGDLQEAERQYLASLAKHPGQHRVLGALGTIALRRDDLATAERRFQEALAQAPTYVEAMGNLGFIAAVRGDEAGARSWYERALVVDPTYPHVHRRLADLFYDRREYGRALDNYRRALEVLPEGFEVMIQAGNSARFLGDAAAAAAYYAEAGAVRPDSWIPPYNTACLQAVNGQLEPALASLGRAADLGFAAPALLENNEDFDGLRPLVGWGALVTRVQEAASRAGTDPVRSG
jgi:Tfp pilus assembly protein PilF